MKESSPGGSVQKDKAEKPAPIKGRRSKGYMKRRPSMLLLTRIEAASRLGISPMTLIRWERAGRLPVLRFGPNMIRYRVQDIAKLEQEALVNAP